MTIDQDDGINIIGRLTTEPKTARKYMNVFKETTGTSKTHDTDVIALWLFGLGFVLFAFNVAFLLTDFNCAKIIKGIGWAAMFVCFGVSLLLVFPDEIDMVTDYEGNRKDFISLIINNIGVHDLVLSKDDYRVITTTLYNISNLIDFLVIIDKQKTVELLVDNYPNIKAISQGIEQAFAIGDDDTDDVKKLMVEYKKQLSQLCNDLYGEVQPYVETLVFQILKDKRYDFLPDNLRRTIIRQHNHRLVADLAKVKDV